MAALRWIWRPALVVLGFAMTVGVVLFGALRSVRHDCATLPGLIDQHRLRIGALVTALDENDLAADEALARVFEDAARETDAVATSRPLARYAAAHRDRLLRGAAATRAMAASARAGDRAEAQRAKAALAIDGVSMQGKEWNDVIGGCTE